MEVQEEGMEVEEEFVKTNNKCVHSYKLHYI